MIRIMMAGGDPGEVMLAAAAVRMSNRAAQMQLVVEAAEGLCHGEDWNRGTHAITHGYRAKLNKAVRNYQAALTGAKEE
jgi:hypothetical protein